ncbi:MAG: SAM-dependent methyltransferase [Woeseiaceae bacterium]|nr:SAM-dependent methyltransferase [Woeseiaceae bacterium]
MQPQHLPTGLPAPDPDSLAHSRRVARHIAQRIAAEGGRLSFGEFMHEALYAPGLGYYVAGNRKFGAAGDFVTAPEVSPLFGRVIARQCAEVAGAMPRASILEIGAGSGALAAQLLCRLRDLDALPERYLILEVSAELAARQRVRLERECPEAVGILQWVDTVPDRFAGTVIANEVADALPVERFRMQQGVVHQAFVNVAEDGGFAWEWRAASPRVDAAVRDLGIDFADGYESEICLGLKPWIGDLVDAVDRGLLLIFDYGLPRHDYYAHGRSGWLRCTFRHRAHDDPLILPGIQDLTAWVDFTAVAEAAVSHEAAVAGYVTQAMFLLQGGLENEFAAASAASTTERAELSRQVKLLTLPSEMGENFKCIGLAKGDVVVPAALRGIDMTASL